MISRELARPLAVAGLPRHRVQHRLTAPAGHCSAPSRSRSGCSRHQEAPLYLPPPAHVCAPPLRHCWLPPRWGAQWQCMELPAELGARQVGRGYQPGPRPHPLPNPLPFLTRNGCALGSVRQGCRCWLTAPLWWGRAGELPPTMICGELMVGGVLPRPDTHARRIPRPQGRERRPAPRHL